MIVAYIYCTYKGTNSLTVEMQGLDKTWEYGTRTVYWYCTVAQSGKTCETAYYGEESDPDNPYYQGRSFLESTVGVPCGFTVGGSKSLSGLNPSTRYFIKAVITDSDGNVLGPKHYAEASTTASGEVVPETWFISGEYLDTPEPGEGIFYYIEHSAMQLGRYNISFENSGYANFFIIGASANFRIYLGTDPDAYDYINGVPTSYHQYSTLGFACFVEANTEYYVWVRAEDGRDALSGTLCIQPPSEETIVTNVPRWSWDSSNGTANLEQTKAAHNALLNLESTTNFHYKVWNDLYQKTLSILQERNEAGVDDIVWDNKDGEYSSAGLVNMGTINGYTLTAKRFNSLRHNIDRLSYTGIGEVSPGDVVRAYYFLRFAECLNDWIDNHQG